MLNGWQALKVSYGSPKWLTDYAPDHLLQLQIIEAASFLLVIHIGHEGGGVCWLPPKYFEQTRRAESQPIALCLGVATGGTRGTGNVCVGSEASLRTWEWRHTISLGRYSLYNAQTVLGWVR